MEILLVCDARHLEHSIVEVSVICLICLGFFNMNQVFNLQLELSRSSLKVLLAANLKFLSFS